MNPPALQVGVVFPHAEISGDPVAIHDFAVTAEALGFSHILAFDHVLGAHPDTPGYEGRYTSHTGFTEPLVLFAYLAAATRTLGLVSGIVILPQRQAALVAKQSADVAILSGGRLRLGIGTGWNRLEYEALGVPFEQRGARQEEQIALLRRLWTEETVTFEGRWHRLSNVGITPRPRESVPIWFGGNSDPVLRRVAKMGDGWFPLARPGDDLEPLLGRLHGYARDVGRDPRDIGIEGFVNFEGGDPERWRRQADAWRTAGASHISLRTQPTVLPEARPGHGIQYHLDALRRYAEAVFAPAG